MKSTRIPCIRCGTMILEVTAEHFNGICGICKKNDDTRPRRLALARQIKTKSIWEGLLISAGCMLVTFSLVSLLYWLKFGLLFWLLLLPLSLIIICTTPLGLGCLYYSIKDLSKSDSELLDD